MADRQHIIERIRDKHRSNPSISIEPITLNQLKTLGYEVDENNYIICYKYLTGALRSRNHDYIYQRGEINYVTNTQDPRGLSVATDAVARKYYKAGAGQAVGRHLCKMKVHLDDIVARSYDGSLWVYCLFFDSIVL
jgi:hypothetical protein